MIGASSRPWVVLVVVALVASLWPSGPVQAGPPRRPTTPATVSGSAGPGVANAAVIAALGLDASLVESISFGNSDQAGWAVQTTPAAGLPTQGASYLVLSSGCAASALAANNDPDFSCVHAADKIKTPGGGEDLVQMTLVLKPPSWAKSWSVQTKFFSEEFDEYVGQGLNDTFLIEQGNTTFTVASAEIIAPNNVAYDTNGQLFSVDTTGVTSMTAAAALGTTYDGATPVLATAANIPLGSSTISLIFSIFDVGDSVYDSTMFLDNFVFSASEAPPGSVPTLGSITGFVFKDAVSNPNLLIGAFVELCRADYSICRSMNTQDTRGLYVFEALPVGDYFITAWPPSGFNSYNKGTIGPLSLTIAAPTMADKHIVLTGPKPLPPNTTLTNLSIGADGVPVVLYNQTLTLTTQGCPGGSATYQVIAFGAVVRTGGMTEGPPGTYTATIAPLIDVGGSAQIKFTITCPNNTSTTTEFDIYIDPSGHVRTVQGAPVVDATVTLYRFDDATSQFVQVPNLSAIMSPKNRINPDLTDSTGHFGWDVAAGLYKVRASKAGCTAPYTGALYVETEVMVIPPPVFDLDLRLNCGGTANGWGETTWYFAEGYTGTGFDEYLTIQNPNASTAELTITYYLGGGQAPVTKNVSVPGNSRYTVAVHETSQGVGRGQEVSAKVVSTNGVGVVVERPMYFSYASAAVSPVTGGHNVMGVTAPRTSWLFAEGYTGAGFDEYLTIMNPNGAIAPVTITYYLAGGGTVVKNVNVAANSRYTVVVHDTTQGVGRDQAVSAKVETSLAGGIVVERPMYFTYTGSMGVAGGGHNVMGAPGPMADWFFAEGYTGSGFDGFVTIMNPFATAAEVRLTYYVTGQATPTVKTITVAANSRRTVVLHDTTEGVGRDKSFGLKVEVTNSTSIVVERPIYFRYGAAITGGHNVMGANRTRAVWLFAEGYTGTGFDEYLTLLNPGNTNAAITVTYYLASGAPVTRSVTVPPIGRATLNVHDAGQVGRNQAVSAKLESTNGIAIIAERPMYFTYNGSTPNIDGGHTVMGYAP